MAISSFYRLVLVLGALLTSANAQAEPQSSAKLGAPAVAAAPKQALADPGTLFALSARVGATYRFVVHGNSQGTIWGDGIYTSDSVLAAVAVHAGLLKAGESGIVSVEVVPGLAAYEGAERNGVVSRTYGAWAVAYRVMGVEPLGEAAVLADPGNVSEFRGQDGTVLRFEVTGSEVGSVWGSGIYTDDSLLAAAAVHSGALRPGETDVITVEILPGQDDYEASEQHGIASASYAKWHGSFRILPPLGSKVGGKLTN